MVTETTDAPVPQTFMGRYFPDEVDYPRLRERAEILPFGELWSYVSSSFLNGFVNSCSDKPPLRAYVFGRYTAADETPYKDCDDRPSYQEPPGSFKWQQVDESLTKRQLFDLLTRPSVLAHTRLGIFSDDVLALFYSKLDDGKDCYWFFWFDMDVSDCGIGRFVTEDSQEVVVAKFDAYVSDRSAAIGCEHEPWLLPTHFFTGWMEF